MHTILWPVACVLVLIVQGASSPLRAGVPGIELVLSEDVPFLNDPRLRWIGSSPKLCGGPLGHVVAVATLTDEADGATLPAVVFVAPGGAPEVVVRRGDKIAAVGSVEMEVNGIYEAFVDQRGRLAVMITVIHPEYGGIPAVLAGPPDDLTIVAYGGQSIGDAGQPGEVLEAIDGLQMTTTGRLFFYGETNRGRESIWTGAPDASTQAITVGRTYPGMPDEARFRFLARVAAYNGSGDIFFFGDQVRPIEPGSGSTTSEEGMWLYSRGRMEPSLQESGEAWDELPEHTVNPVDGMGADPRLTDDGWLLMSAQIKPINIPNVTLNGVCLQGPASSVITLILAAGGRVPDVEGAELGSFFFVKGFIDGGTLAFMNMLRLADGKSAGGLCRIDANGEFRTLALIGAPLPSPDGETVSRLGGMGLSPVGLAVFDARMSGPLDSVLWIVDRDAPPQRLLGRGDLMPLANGANTTLGIATFMEASGDRSFDAKGRFLVRLTPSGTGGSSIVWVDPNVILHPPEGVISGMVFDDADGDRRVSAGDKGLGGVRLELYLADGEGNPLGERLQAVESGTNGSYAFDSVIAGIYVVVEANPSGYYSISDSQGGNDDRIVVSLPAGEVSAGNDFLDYKPLTAGGEERLRIVGWTIKERRFRLVLAFEEDGPLTLWRNRGLNETGWSPVEAPEVSYPDAGTAVMTDPQPVEGQMFYRVTQTAEP